MEGCAHPCSHAEVERELLLSVWQPGMPIDELFKRLDAMVNKTAAEKKRMEEIKAVIATNNNEPPCVQPAVCHTSQRC